MFERFLTAFPQTSCSKEEATEQELLPRLLSKASSTLEFFSKFEGCTFSHGLYRVHSLSEIEKWTRIVEKAFPQFKGIIQCFGYDWLGRQFALDSSRYLNDEPLVLMFDICNGKALKIPVSFQAFHNLEMVDYSNDVLESDLFLEWKSYIRDEIQPNQCVGCKVPLFLNGEDDIENFEILDIEVYWEVFGQLLEQARNLPASAKISRIQSY